MSLVVIVQHALLVDEPGTKGPSTHSQAPPPSSITPGFLMSLACWQAGWCLPLCAKTPPSHHPRFPRSLTCWQAGWCLPSVSSPPHPPPSTTPGFQQHSLVNRLHDALLVCVKPPSPPTPQVSNIAHLLTGWVMPGSSVSSPCPLHHPRFPTSLTCWLDALLIHPLHHPRFPTSVTCWQAGWCLPLCAKTTTPLFPPSQVSNITHLLTGWVMPCPSVPSPSPSFQPSLSIIW